jgi:decaprenyl-phosphate phosphoribosyltransferase
VTATEVDPHPGPAVALVRAMRPRQWVKNLLVLAAPLAAGALDDAGVAGATAVAVIAFCLASSAVYLLNDVVDVEADRRHPVKRTRPIAAGLLSPRVAVTASGVLAVATLAMAAVTGWQLVVLLLVYLGLQAAYTVWLKHMTVVDIAVVASGFLLRAVAGGVAAELPISQWFLMVAGFGSLFIVAGKRYSELRLLGNDGATRRSLVMYTESYLRFVWGVATGLTVMSYSLWAFREPDIAGVPWHALSIAPFVLALLRYAVDVDAGRAGEPEEIIWHDRVLQVLGVAWLLLVGVGVMSA